MSLWHSFEHFPDPCSFLDEIYRVLRPSGIAVFAVPNHGGWLSQWTRQDWFALDVPRHLFHYDQQSLSRLIESHDLRIEHISTLSLEQDILGTAQSLMNIAGFGQNVLYDLIKRRDSQSTATKALSFGDLVILTIASGISLALSLPLCLAASLARSGGTLEIWCRK